jgi:1,4-dihydroxy-2-naphthoate octaprenyltransferase
MGPAGKVRFWLKAMRSISFPLSMLPVALGTAVGVIRGVFDPLNFLFALLGSVSAHAGINLISDYNDFKKGVDTTDALSSHPGALVNELVRPESLLIASFLTFALTATAGSLLLLRSSYPVLLFGLAGLLGGSLYTSGPLAYKYVGLGELFIALLMGPLMVVGACYVQTGTVDLLAFLLSLTLGSLVASVTLSNNLRDLIDDARARMRTLPGIIHVGPAKVLYIGMIALPSAVIAIQARRTAGSTPEEIRAKAAERKYPLNSIRLHIRFSLLLILGCLLIALLPRIL